MRVMFTLMRWRGRIGLAVAGLIAVSLSPAAGLRTSAHHETVPAVTMASAQTSGKPLTDSAFFDLQGGKLDPSTGLVDSASTFLSPSTGFQSLDTPYTYVIPAGTAAIRYVVKYTSTDPITPTDKSSWITITAGTSSTTSPPSAVSDPAFYAFEQGTISSGTGLNEEPANSTRIRLSAPAAVDSTWKTLQFANATDTSLQITIFAYSATHTLALSTPASIDPSWKALQFADPNSITDANFARTYYVQVFPYDSDGNFLGQTSGWHLLDGTPYVYAVPPNTAEISYELEYLNGDPMSVTDQSAWVTITPASAPPAYDYYQLHDQAMAPEFSIPGLAGAQTAAWVNGDLWDSGASSSDNPIGGPAAPANGVIDVWSIDWSTHQSKLIHQFQNNFGHMNAWGWSPINNDMIIGNGGTNYTLPPAFYVVPVANINLDGTNTLASTNAIIYTVPASFGDRPGMTWTDTPNVAIMDTDSGTTIRKIRLDTGTDQGRYGTYQAAAAGQYNGTYDVLDTYHLYDSLGGTLYPQAGSYPDQNPVWIQGKLVIGVGDGNTMAMGVITLGEHGQMTYRIYHDDNNYADFQGVFYDPKDGYMGGLTDAGTAAESLYVWHSSNWTWQPLTTPPAQTPPQTTVS